MRRSQRAPAYSAGRSGVSLSQVARAAQHSFAPVVSAVFGSAVTATDSPVFDGRRRIGLALVRAARCDAFPNRAFTALNLKPGHQFRKGMAEDDWRRWRTFREARVRQLSIRAEVVPPAPHSTRGRAFT